MKGYHIFHVRNYLRYGSQERQPIGPGYTGHIPLDKQRISYCSFGEPKRSRVPSCNHIQGTRL